MHGPPPTVHASRATGPVDPTTEGPLVLVDISGYTTFVAETELSHSQILIAELLDAVLASMGSHLRASGIEGDAVFFVGDRREPELMTWVDDTYIAFHRRLRSVVKKRAAFCACQACVRAPTLTVKVIAHHGRYSRYRVGQVEQVHGADVILLHRLAKNHIPSHEYVLATEALLMNLPAERHGGFTMVDEDILDLGRLTVGYRELGYLRSQLGSPGDASEVLA